MLPIFLLFFYSYILSFFVFLMLRPPPISTLFPYTTLFRSRPRRWRRVLPLADRSSCPQRQPCRDRKSTRLNSSHRTISYVVFCLKKKNNVYLHQKRLEDIQYELMTSDNDH